MCASEVAKASVVRVAAKIVASMGEGLILGLGTGSTSAMFVRELAEHLRTSGKHAIRAVVPTSIQSEMVAIELGFECLSPHSAPNPDIYVDSFDQCDIEGNLIKGGGGALAREKVLLLSSKKALLIGDESKLKDRLEMPIPVEVLPFAATYFERTISRRGWVARLRTGTGKAGPIVTENGNLIFDVSVPTIDDVSSLESEMKLISGVVEVGLFPYRGYRVLIGKSDGSVVSVR